MSEIRDAIREALRAELEAVEQRLGDKMDQRLREHFVTEGEYRRARAAHEPDPDAGPQTVESLDPDVRPTRLHGARGIDLGNNLVLKHLGPDNQPIDAKMRAEMWRPDAVQSCPCGKAKYVTTRAVVGEQDIREAQQPVISVKGAILQQPWRYAVHPDTGRNLVPESLRMTPDKRAHLEECAETHSPWNRMGEDEQKAAVKKAADAISASELKGPQIGATPEEKKRALSQLRAVAGSM